MSTSTPQPVIIDEPLPLPKPQPQPETAVKFPYPIVIIVLVWLLLGIAYVIKRWRQRPKQQYIIPRVFVLCSPRTVQFHYELILRVGLPSVDFNPDRHDIDITVQGISRNEVVPMTRLNTKTLMDEPLITSLSIVVYRLVEMPPLGTLKLNHSGPFRGSLYAYDFTVIDLATNREQYYTINQYIGSLNKTYHLDQPTDTINVQYPIDDVPLPQWTIEDIFIILTTVVNCLMLTSGLMPLNCTTVSDVVSTILASIQGLALVFFLDWFLYYYLRWSQDRYEYFNQTESRCFGWENVFRFGVIGAAVLLGLGALYYNFGVVELKDSIVWLLATTNSFILVLGTWIIGHNADWEGKLVALGLRFRGQESVPAGIHYSEVSSTIQTKSGSASDDENIGSNLSKSTQFARSIGPRSSVKSFGFNPTIAQLYKIQKSQSKRTSKGK